jgi:hypothetical protein
MWPPAADTATAQGIGGAGPPQVAIGRGAGPKAMRCGGTPGTPGKPGFRRSRKCAQMKFGQNLIYLLTLYKEKHYIAKRIAVLAADLADKVNSCA